MPDPGFQPPDDTARRTAAALLARAQTAALGVTDETGAPVVTKIGFATLPGGVPLTLISDLSPHTAALRERPHSSLLIEAPVEKGDPLNSPRLTLAVTAEFLPRDESAWQDARAAYLDRNPKAKLYIGFGDFHLVRFSVDSAHLNGGFGKAFLLTAEDLSAASDLIGPGS